MNHVIALSPTDLAPAQQSLIGWCDKRIEHWIAEQKESTEGLEHATKNKWKTEPFRRLVQKANRRIGFYRKVKSAIEAGYLIVPNFPIEVFAIRTNAVEARSDESMSRWETFRQSAKALPQGSGQYVNPIPAKYSDDREVKDGKTQTFYYPAELDTELEIPLHLVKPEIMRAVDKARALKLFDQIGIVTDRQADPIVCGQILEGAGFSAKRVTFFLAWYVDLDAI